MDLTFLQLSFGFLHAIFYAIAWYYVVKFTSRGFLNVKNYLSLFLILLPAMVLIISVIKSSLALSLGLVGALSIIRFRTPIKEPIELMYFFVPIALGLSLGAEQYLLGFVFFVIVSSALLVISKFRGGLNRTSSYCVEISMGADSGVELVNEVMAKVFSSYDLQRLNVQKDKIVLSYKVADIEAGVEEELINEVNGKIKNANISIFNNSHIVS